jgi:hypothetical protein
MIPLILIVIFSSVSPTGERTAIGVEMADGTVLTADNILTGCSPYHTFVELMGDHRENNKTNNKSNTPTTIQNTESNGVFDDFSHHVKSTDFSCGAFKINCAVDRLPNFTCYPSPEGGEPGPMHRGKYVRMVRYAASHLYLNCCDLMK